MPENKVKYNLKNTHWAKLTVDDEGIITFGTPQRIPGSVSISLSPSGDSSPFYADGIEYYTSIANNGYEGDLEIAMVPLMFEQEILKNELDDNKVLIEKNDIEPEHFALMFEFDGDVTGTKHVMYNCTATRPDIASKTVEDKKEVQTDKLSIKAIPLSNGHVKAKTTATTTAEAIANWFKSVYVKTSTPAA